MIVLGNLIRTFMNEFVRKQNNWLDQKCKLHRPQHNSLVEKDLNLNVFHTYVQSSPHYLILEICTSEIDMKT